MKRETMKQLRKHREELIERCAALDAEIVRLRAEAGFLRKLIEALLGMNRTGPAEFTAMLREGLRRRIAVVTNGAIQNR